MQRLNTSDEHSYTKSVKHHDPGISVHESFPGYLNANFQKYDFDPTICSDMSGVRHRTLTYSRGQRPVSKPLSSHSATVSLFDLK